MLVLASTIGAGWATGAAAADEPRLLLLPVVVHSAEAPEYLRDGLSDMLASRFSRIGSIDLIRPDADSRGTTDRARAIALARKVDADYVLFGSFTRFGKGASLDVQCAPVSEDKQRTPLREIFVHSGSIGEIIPDLDELAGKVSRFVRGESVYPAAPEPGGAPLAAAASDEFPSDSQIEDLEYRIEALEAALTELLESDAGVEMDSETGTDEELR
jgi:TolB-like protein